MICKKCRNILFNYFWNGDCKYNEKGEMISYNEEMKCEKCNEWFIVKIVIHNQT